MHHHCHFDSKDCPPVFPSLGSSDYLPYSLLQAIAGSPFFRSLIESLELDEKIKAAVLQGRPMPLATHIKVLHHYHNDSKKVI